MIKVILIALIKGYQYSISPLMGHCCRFYPSCSSYAEEVIKQWGVSKGVYLSIRRLLRCHPLHRGGVDLAPKNHVNKRTIVS